MHTAWTIRALGVSLCLLVVWKWAAAKLTCIAVAVCTDCIIFENGRARAAAKSQGARIWGWPRINDSVIAHLRKGAHWIWKAVASLRVGLRLFTVWAAPEETTLQGALRAVSLTTGSRATGAATVSLCRAITSATLFIDAVRPVIAASKLPAAVGPGAIELWFIRAFTTPPFPTLHRVRSS